MICTKVYIFAVKIKFYVFSLVLFLLKSQFKRISTIFQCYLTKIQIKPSELLLRILDFRSSCCLCFPKRLVQLLMNFKISTSLISVAYKLLLIEYNKCSFPQSPPVKYSLTAMIHPTVGSGKSFLYLYSSWVSITHKYTYYCML